MKVINMKKDYELLGFYLVHSTASGRNSFFINPIGKLLRWNATESRVSSLDPTTAFGRKILELVIRKGRVLKVIPPEVGEAKNA